MKELYKCSKCRVEKPVSNFQLSKTQKPSGQCRQCKTEYMKQCRKDKGVKERKFSFIDNESKLCLRCNEIKPLSDFSPSIRGLGGLSSYCKPCTTNKNRDKEKTKAATAKYRENNREKCLKAGREGQVKRRLLEKSLDDGTITKDFINSLYATENCYYCSKSIDRVDRTIDHRTPLSKQGLHSASNLVMACKSCNFSKVDKSPEEYFKYLREF